LKTDYERSVDKSYAKKRQRGSSNEDQECPGGRWMTAPQ
jgi:hypothetical protein